MKNGLIVVVVLAAIVFGWMLNDTFDSGSGYELASSDTTFVEVPLPVIQGSLTAKPIIPKSGQEDRYEKLAEEAKAVADSLRIVLATNEAERDLFLENTLPLLLSPKSAKTEIEGPNYRGHLWLFFNPMPLPGKFEYEISIVPRVPYITHNVIRREPWWVKPAVGLTAALAVYYADRDKPVHALLTGGTAVTLTLVEF